MTQKSEAFTRKTHAWWHKHHQHYERMLDADLYSNSAEMLKEMAFHCWKQGLWDRQEDESLIYTEFTILYNEDN